MSERSKGRDKTVCYRCGRRGHWVKNCVARIDTQRKKRKYAK